jgi:hypothetical protein
VLTGEISPGMVDEVIGLAGCREKRRRLLPARTVVYFVLGLCLFSGADSMAPPGYRSVMRWLTNGLRLVAWDGTGIDAADTPANAAAFGGVQGGGPQLRLLALIECGTHALIDAVFDGVARASEQKLARRLLPALGPGMLLLADRNFPGWELWGLAAGTGADLAWRIKKNLVFTPLTMLPDGSFLSVMPTPAENLRLGQARAASSANSFLAPASTACTNSASGLRATISRTPAGPGGRAHLRPSHASSCRQRFAGLAGHGLCPAVGIIGGA